MAKKLARFYADGRIATLKDPKYAEEIGEVLSFYPPGSAFMPQVKQGIWDGKIRMLNKHTHQVPIGLLRAPEIRSKLSEEGFDIRLKKWTNRPTYKRKPGFTEKHEKYQYQNECVDAMLKAIPFGGGIVLSATGSGKTKMAAQFKSWVASPCLFIVDQIDLLYQSAKEIEEWLHEPVGIVGNSKFQPSDGLTVATIQTLHKHRENKLFRQWLKSIQIVIIDELHAQMARRNFTVVDLIEAQAVFGLTATLQLKKKPVRMKAFAIAGPVIFEFSVEDGMDQEVLSKGIALEVQVEDNKPEPLQMQLFAGMTAKVRMRAKSDQYDKVVVRNADTNAAVANILACALQRGYYCVVLVERIAHIMEIDKLMRERHWRPVLCYGAVGTDERKKLRKDFEKGNEELIIANQVFKKGINLKRVDLIIDAAQRGNKNDILQKFGRGVRLHSEKRGLIFMHMTSIPTMEKYGKQRSSAFRSAKIPVIKTRMKTAVEILKLGESALTKFIKS